MSSLAATEIATTFVEKRPLERYAEPAQPSLVGMPRPTLAQALAEVGVPEGQRRMRVQQIWHWLYVRGAKDFDAMTTLSKDLRAALARRFTLARPPIAAEQISVDGTRKWLVQLPGERAEAPHEVECVYIPETDRGTLCISSQVGCTLNCSFCHTGTQRLVRNLTAAEIAAQVVVARDRLGDWAATGELSAPSDLASGGERRRLVSNVVMMGMGEPLYNFEAVRDGINVIADGDGLSISKRRITLSTSGVVPNIARAGAEIGSMLAISLHAVTDELRNQLVPLNRKYPIAGGLPELSRPVERAAHHLRICDAQGRQRLAHRRQGAGAPPQRHPRQDQPDPVQSLARNEIRVLRLGSDRKILRSGLRRRLCLSGAHAAWARHSCRVWPA
jgi:23S rRNA (adenine2503-C2)-methyltransferase